MNWRSIMKKGLTGKRFSKLGILIYFCVNKVEVTVLCSVATLNHFWYATFMHRIIYFSNFPDAATISSICKLLLFSTARI